MIRSVRYWSSRTKCPWPELIRRGLVQDGSWPTSPSEVRIRSGWPGDALTSSTSTSTSPGRRVRTCHRLRAENVTTRFDAHGARHDRGSDRGLDTAPTATSSSRSTSVSSSRGCGRWPAARPPPRNWSCTSGIVPRSGQSPGAPRRTDIDLSAKEVQILEVFMRHPDEVLSRLQLLERAWDASYENRSNVIDVYIGYLREKIDRPFGAHSLETVRGAGYRLRGS